MICTKCGAALAEGTKFCGQCGAARPLPPPRLDPDFAKAEAAYGDLKRLYNAGTLAADPFKAAVGALTVESGGRFWMLGVDSGEWYVHDGAAWRKAEPAAPPAASTAPRPAAPRVAQPPPAQPKPVQTKPAPAPSIAPLSGSDATLAHNRWALVVGGGMWLFIGAFLVLSSLGVMPVGAFVFLPLLVADGVANVVAGIRRPPGGRISPLMMLIGLMSPAIIGLLAMGGSMIDLIARAGVWLMILGLLSGALAVSLYRQAGRLVFGLHALAALLLGAVNLIGAFNDDLIIRPEQAVLVYGVTRGGLFLALGLMRKPN